MKAFLTAVLASAVLAVGAWFGLDALDLSSANATASESVRLD